MYTDPSFFLIGLPRTGTKLLQAIISSAEDSWLSPECHWLPFFFKASHAYLKYYKSPDSHDIKRDRWNDCLRLFNRILVEPNESWGLQVIGLQNAYFIHELSNLYPDSKFIFLIRDPRDAFLSMLRTGIAVFPSEFLKLYQTISSLNVLESNNFQVVRYEDLILKPKDTVSKIADFIGCSYDQRMLFPLTQRISGNVVPAITQKDFKQGNIKTKQNIVRRYKRQLLDEDLLDFDFLYSLLKIFDYEVCEKNKLKLSISSSTPYQGKLIGAKRNDDESNFISLGEHVIDICSVGVFGVVITEGHQSIQRISLEGVGDLTPSATYKHTYVKRLISSSPDLSINEPIVHTWTLFQNRVRLPEKSKLAIYTAGGATASFIDHIKKIKTSYHWDCIIDQKREGVLGGLPIVTLHKALQREIDYIIITSVPYYSEIKTILSGYGLKEIKDYCLVCFANQTVG
jgi:hypothetical protein